MAREFVVRGVLNETSGYGYQTSLAVKAILSRGIGVRTEAIEIDEGSVKIDPTVTKTLITGSGVGCELLIDPPKTPGHLKRDVFRWTMMEYYRLAPDELENLKRSSGIAVTNESNVATLCASGIDCPIFIVPMCVDTRVFKPNDLEFNANTPITVFGTAGIQYDGGIRKNFGAVVEAFGKAFPHQGDVRLFIKVKEGCPLPEIKDPRIQILKSTITKEEMAKWLRALSCYVSTSRGEGWGLIQHQAMACGIPVIGVKSLGMREFFDESVGFPLESKLVPCGWPDRGLWHEPEMDSIVYNMRKVYENRYNAARVGSLAADRARMWGEKRFVDSLMVALKGWGLI